MNISDPTLSGSVPSSEADSFTARLESGRPILIDGGLATQCEAMGCNIDGELWSATLLQSDPRAIVDAHRAYLDVGAEIIATASYQASRYGFMATGSSADEADPRPGTNLGADDESDTQNTWSDEVHTQPGGQASSVLGLASVIRG